MADFNENENLTEAGIVSMTVSITGGGSAWHYTNADRVITSSGGTDYHPVPLMTSSIKADGTLGGNDVDVSLPRNVPVADLFFPQVNEAVYRVVLKQAHHAQGVIVDDRLAFSGVISSTSSSEDGTQFKMKCTTNLGMMSRPGLRRRYQLQCPFLLFGNECRASRLGSQFQANIAVGSVPNATWGDVYLTFYGEDPEEPTMWRGRDLREYVNRIFMVGAVIRFQGVDYKIADLSSRDNADDSKNTFRVMLFDADKDAMKAAISAAAPTDRVATITPNCDHSVNCCVQIFGNGNNYGGMPAIPYENPVKSMFVGM